jgi:hypothetical protein
VFDARGDESPGIRVALLWEGSVHPPVVGEFERSRARWSRRRRRSTARRGTGAYRRSGRSADGPRGNSF